MDGLIQKLKKRDTKKNIEQIQRELDEMAASSNPLKKCLSMYKINKKMESLSQIDKANDDIEEANRSVQPKNSASSVTKRMMSPTTK